MPSLADASRLNLRKEARYLALIFCGALALYGFTMPRGVTLEDSGELISVARHGGIAHPPGYPTYTLLAAAFLKLPVGSPALRVHALSAVSAAAACSCLYLCALLLLRRRPPALLCAALYASSATLWAQAIIAEVYALHALFFFALLALCLNLQRHFDTRSLRFGAFLFGLSLTNHWPLMVLATPSLLVLVWPQRGKVAGQAPWLIALFLLGLTPYLYLLISAQLRPAVTAFGDVHTLSEFVAYISRARYSTLELSSSASIADSLQFALFFLRSSLHQFGLPVAGLLPIGAAALWQRGRPSELLSLGWAFIASSIVLLLFVRWEFDDIHSQVYVVYQLVPFGVASILAGSSAAWLLDSPRLASALRRPAVLTLSVASLAICLSANFAANDMRRDTLAEDYARAVLETLPRDARLVVNADVDTAPIAYVQLVKGVRSDVAVYSRTGFLFPLQLSDASKPGWQRRAASRLSALVEQQGRVFNTDIGHTELVTAIFTPEGQMEYRSPHRVLDHGLYYQIAERPVSIDEDALLARASQVLDAELAGHYSDHWRYLKEIILGKFCSVLIRADRVDHPVMQRVPHCLRALALRHAARSEFEQAAEIWWRLIESDFKPSAKERASLYNDYFLMRANIISRNPPEQPDAAYQTLADQVWPALALYAGCDNPVANNLLALATLTPLEVPLLELRDRFGTCPSLRARFAALAESSGAPSHD